MARKPISIRRSLFLYGFIPMFICSVLFSIILLPLTTELIKKQEENSLINQTRALSNLMDNELRKIKRVSLNLAYSENLKEEVKTYKNLKTSEQSPKELYYGTRKIQSILDEMVGPLKQIPQVNIILPDKEMVCFGLYNLSQELPDHLHPRMNKLTQQKKQTYWTPPERDFLAESIGGEVQKNYISYFQVLYDEYRNPLAYIEVKQEMEILFSELNEIAWNFQVFNEQNLQIYPQPTPYGNSFSLISSEYLPYVIQHARNNFTREKEVLCMGISREASWRIITIKNETHYMGPVYKIQRILIPIVLFIAFLGYLISHKLSVGISTSLTNLNRKLNQMQLVRTPSETKAPEKSAIRELNDLEVSFSEMNRKMDEKLNIFVAEKTLEVNARMLALQSQMDPHFLFNMLSIISIMAEDEQVEEIQDVIHHLSNLLRYVSSLKELTVPVSLEIEMAKHYMRCISYRFDDSVQFILNLPEDLGDLRIPKYSIIPLLENAVKYGMTDLPPCKIILTLLKKDNYWFIKTEDNGAGFENEELNNLLKRISEGIHNPKLQLNNQINGMGLFNICSRYSLLYGKDFRFEAGNAPEGGALIILGGTDHVK